MTTEKKKICGELVLLSLTEHAPSWEGGKDCP